MAITSEQRTLLRSQSLPSLEAVIEITKDYMARTDMAPGDFARRINYAQSTFYLFLKGEYAKTSSNDLPLRSAIMAFITANPIVAHSFTGGKMYETENVRLIRKYFHKALDNRCAYYFRGAPGCQKSFVLESLIAELNIAEISKNGHGRRAYYVYCPNKVTPAALMKLIAEASGSLMTGSIRRIISNLRFDFGTRKVLICLDEAQHLDVDCLETVRELIDRPPFCGLLFAGSHSLETTFNRLDMEQWNSRLFHGQALPGLSVDESINIMREELGHDLPDKKMMNHIDKCYATDLRNGTKVRYISARILFRSIAGIKQNNQKVLTV